MQAQVKSEAVKRLRTARGHLESIIHMVDSEKYCIDILQQSLAVQSALRAVDHLILKGHLEEHVSHAMQGKNKDKSIREVIEIFDKSRR